MEKDYYKRSEIDNDIKCYQAKLRSLQPSTREYGEVKEFICGLKERKKDLIKKNSNNPAFFHNGIPPLKNISKKQKVLDELYREKHEMKLRHDKEISELNDKIKLTKQSKDYVKRGSI